MQCLWCRPWNYTIIINHMKRNMKVLRMMIVGMMLIFTKAFMKKATEFPKLIICRIINGHMGLYSCLPGDWDHFVCQGLRHCHVSMIIYSSTSAYIKQTVPPPTTPLPYSDHTPPYSPYPRGPGQTWPLTSKISQAALVLDWWT